MLLWRMCWFGSIRRNLQEIKTKNTTQTMRNDGLVLKDIFLMEEIQHHLRYMKGSMKMGDHPYQQDLFLESTVWAMEQHD